MKPRPDANILIIGLRGAGKSTIARRLGERLGRPSLDLDDATLALLKVMTVADAWSMHGEPAFREAEARALRDALAIRGRIIALGGGTPTAPGAEQVIRCAQRDGAAVVIYLRAAPGLLAERVRHDPPHHRPRLLGLDNGGAIKEMEAVYAARHPLYESIADYIIDASGDRDAVLRDAESACASADGP